MDAFYVSVELVRRPHLRGRPVLVATGTDPSSRGVVMAASYEAREFGVHSALPLARAHRLCPQAVILPRDMQLYQRASRAVMEVLRRYSDRIEVAGLDEAYLDLSGSPVPATRARELKQAVKARTRLVCSVGLAPNKLLAKIASDLDKPDGFCELPRERMLELVGERAARIIPGVGPRTAEKLSAEGIKTVRDLATAGDDVLAAALGPRLGPALRARANGDDDRDVTVERVRKSESRETTFGEDVTDPEMLADRVEGLAHSVCRGLESHAMSGRTVTLKIRLRPFRTFTRSRTLPEATRDAELVAATARELLEVFDPPDPVRLLGVGVAGLVADGATPQRESGPAGATLLDDAAEPPTLDAA